MRSMTTLLFILSLQTFASVGFNHDVGYDISSERYAYNNAPYTVKVVMKNSQKTYVDIQVGMKTMNSPEIACVNTRVGLQCWNPENKQMLPLPKHLQSNSNVSHFTIVGRTVYPIKGGALAVKPFSYNNAGELVD